MEGFANLLRAGVVDAAPAFRGIDFEGRKSKWLELVGELYATIEKDWLKKLISRGDIQALESPLRINEQFIGAYDAVRLSLAMDGAFVELTPRGTLVAGANGRVDMSGPGGEVMLVLESPDDASVPFPKKTFFWAAVSPSSRSIRVPLDKDTFGDALTKLVAPF